MSDKRTITLTNRPPVRINDDAWPIVASASDKEFDNQYECQANEITKWFVAFRQHADGRGIVYATFSHSTAWQGRRDLAAKCGRLLDKDDDIVAAINDVCSEISEMPDSGEQHKWLTLAAECIADLPAIDLE